MTAKEFVLQHNRRMRAEKIISGRVKGMQTVYWLIREIGNTMYFAEGKTESNAWVNAKQHILDRINEKQQ